MATDISLCKNPLVDSEISFLYTFSILSLWVSNCLALTMFLSIA